ncbi:MAG TPA: hypothetical protein VJP80_01340 [Candidatus Saccharimonadales bacterium]|nr:hypothetical protein [Candidatus Saccharimonadales bacterium]
MKVKSLVLVAVGVTLSFGAWAQGVQVCIDDGGFFLPCPPTNPPLVDTHFSSSYSSIKVGVPVDIYIVGSGTVIGSSYFLIRANKEVQCRTENDYTTTPIRHCVVTINAPGTYMFDAEPFSGNFNAPSPITVNVTQ